MTTSPMIEGVVSVQSRRERSSSDFPIRLLHTMKKTLDGVIHNKLSRIVSMDFSVFAVDLISNGQIHTMAIDKCYFGFPRDVRNTFEFTNRLNQVHFG